MAGNIKKAFNENVLERFAPVLLIATISMAFLVGILWQKVTTLEKGGITAGTANTENSATPAAAPTVSLDKIKELFNNQDLISFGGDGKKVLFVEVADPSCPYCHVAAGRNPELASQMGENFKPVSDGGTYVPPVIEMKKLVDEGKASFVYLYTPGHGNGEMGTKALYCAHEEDKFWEAHDILMTNAGYTLLNDVVKNDKAQSGKLADFLGAAVDSAKLKSCLESGKYDDQLAKDITIAQSLGVSGTPGFFVNATNFAGAYSFKDMESVVNDALGS